MKVFWTDRAKASLREIETYISKYSEKAARKVVKRVLLRSKQIGSFPYSGREVPEFKREDVREILEKPYRIIYGNTCGRPSRLTLMSKVPVLIIAMHVLN